MLLKNVVIGSSLESILYAFRNEYYHIRSENFFPTFFSGLPEKVLGQKLERDAFNRIKMILALVGLNIEFTEVNQISIKENKIIVSSNLGVSEFLFEKCFVFSMLNLKHQNDILYPKEEEYLVYDDYTISGHPRAHLETEKIEGDTDFVKEIYLYNSGRIDGYQYPTDAITFSRLEKDQIYSFDFFRHNGTISN